MALRILPSIAFLSGEKLGYAVYKHCDILPKAFFYFLKRCMSIFNDINRYFYNENYVLAASLGLYSTMGRPAGAAAASDALAE